MLNMVNKINKYNKLEKVITIAGIMLIILAIISSFFSLWTNRGFVYEPLDMAYYLRYPLLLSGGYFIAYLLQSKRPRELFLFGGASYSLLAITFFFLLDYVRAPLRSLIGLLPYPWGRIVFELVPLTALLVVAIVAFMLKRYSDKNDTSFKRLFIVLFGILQIQMIIFPLLISVIPELSFEILFTLLLNVIFMPLSVAILVFVALKNIKNVLNRLFFSALISVIYFVTLLLLNEFNTNPMAEYVAVFNYTMLMIALASAIVLLRFACRSVR